MHKGGLVKICHIGMELQPNEIQRCTCDMSRESTGFHKEGYLWLQKSLNLHIRTLHYQIILNVLREMEHLLFLSKCSIHIMVSIITFLTLWNCILSHQSCRMSHFKIFPALLTTVQIKECLNAVKLTSKQMKSYLSVSVINSPI